MPNSVFCLLNICTLQILFVYLQCKKQVLNTPLNERSRKIIKLKKMKAIYAKGIKAMVKKFNLSEVESDYLNYIAEAINKECTDLCKDIQMALLYGYSEEEKNAIRALFVYFGAKVQKENELYRKLDRTCWEIAKVLKCGSYQVMQWMKGIACTKDRFGKFVECSDTFGLNYLEIA